MAEAQGNDESISTPKAIFRQMTLSVLTGPPRRIGLQVEVDRFDDRSRAVANSKSSTVVLDNPMRLLQAFRPMIHSLVSTFQSSFRYINRPALTTSTVSHTLKVVIC